MKKLYFLFLMIMVSSLSTAQPVVNEVDADTPGTDTAEFVEISWTASTALDGYVVVFFNGSNDQSYAAFDLDGKTTDANGFFILANTALISGQDIDIGASNVLQNGADAVAIYTANDTDFPNGTAITVTNLVGGVVYGTDDGDDAGLLAVIGGVQYNENMNTLKDTQSVQRKMDGTYEVKNITFRADNSTSCGLSFGTTSYTCLTNTTGAANDNVTIQIPYNGVDATITSVTTTSAGTVGGDDPAVISDGTITITGLSEGDAWDVILNGGNCNGTSTSDTVPANNCDPQFLIINEILADPDSTTGDANGDGTVNTSQDEFIEIYNSDVSSIDLENYTLEDGFGLRHTFPTGSILPASGFITVFGAGTPTGIGGISQVASTTSLGLNNGGDTVILRDDGGAIITQYTYGSEAGNNESIARDPDFTGPFAQHSTITANPVQFSPGGRNDTPVLSSNLFSKIDFQLYPNPVTQGELNIQSINNDAITISIFNVLGKQVLHKELTTNFLDVSALNSGVYIVKLSQNNTTVTKKLIVK